MTHKEQPKQVQVGWLVETTGDPMFFAVEQRDEALLYCEDGAEPVAMYCNKPELEQHTAAQEGEKT